MTVWGLRRPDGASWFELLAYGFFGLCAGRVLSCALDPNKLYSGGVLVLELAFGALLVASSPLQDGVSGAAPRTPRAERP